MRSATHSKRMRHSRAGRPLRRSRAEPGVNKKQGVVLVLVLAVLSVLAVLVADLASSSTTFFKVAESKRDGLQAEYLALSGMDLTRLLIAKEPTIRNAVAGIYALILNHPPPQLNVWDFANELWIPLARPEAAEQITASSGIDFTLVEGLVPLGGSFEIKAIPENGLINASNPLFRSGSAARRQVAMELYALMGGYQSPTSPYDPLFAERDADGQYTTRLDIVSAIVDWWDYDQTRTIFDPATSTVTEAGSEDDIYQTLPDPYEVKNAPYDSLQELRLVRGIGDDFWATFVEPEPDDPNGRRLTVYGSGSVNVNEARPEVLLATLCSFDGIREQALCNDFLQAGKFVSLLNTARSFIPIAMFGKAGDFLNFVEGKGGNRALYPTLVSLLGEENELLFLPLAIPKKIRAQVQRSFIASAAIFTVQSTGTVGNTRVRISAVVNFHNRWAPPPPNAGVMPGLGIFHHYRMD